MFLLIPFMSWAMLVFAVVLPLLSRSCTMFALVLHIVNKYQTSSLYCKVQSKSLFYMPISCTYLVWPKPSTNLLKFWPVCHEIMAFMVATAIYVYIAMAKQSCIISF